MSTYLFFRMVTPIVMTLVTVFYVFVVLKLDQPLMLKIGICMFAAYLGMQPPFCSSRTRSRGASCRSGARFRMRSTCC